MKILVYGAGAIGGYLGARLLQQGHGVTLIMREQTAAVVREHGLIVVEDGKTAVLQPHVVSSVPQAFREDRSYDAVILGMKSYDLAEALDPLAAFCSPDATIITTQNGIDVEKPFIEQFGRERIIVGSLTVPVSREGGNKLIVERPDRGLVLAPAQKGFKLNAWVHLFRSAGVNTEEVKEYESLKWSKALLNIAGNAVSAILNRPPEALYKVPAVFEMERRMFKEAITVMEARKIKVLNLPGAPAKRLARSVKMVPNFLLQPILTDLISKGRGDKMPSFYLDLSAGRQKSEVVYHNGAIAAHGRDLGIATPVNTTYNEVLLGLTHGELNWREFDGSPKRLLAEVAKRETT